VRLVDRLLRVFGGDAPPARLSQIEALCRRLMDASGRDCERLTLGGCLVDVRRAQNLVVRAFREFGRHPLPQAILRPGQGVFWDRRFYLSVAADFAGEIEVRALGSGGLALLAADQHERLPRAALLALPALWANGHFLGLARSLPASLVPSVACRWADQHARALHWQDHGSLTDA